MTCSGLQRGGTDAASSNLAFHARIPLLVNPLHAPALALNISLPPPSPAPTPPSCKTLSRTTSSHPRCPPSPLSCRTLSLTTSSATVRALLHGCGKPVAMPSRCGRGRGRGRNLWEVWPRRQGVDGGEGGNLVGVWASHEECVGRAVMFTRPFVTA